MGSEIADDVDLVRELVREAWFSISYHEDQLLQAHKRLAAIEGLLARAKIAYDQVTAREAYEEASENDAEPIDDVEEWARYLVGQNLFSISYHEDGLRDGHAKLAKVKALMLRGNYTEVSIEEIAERVQRRVRGAKE